MYRQEERLFKILDNRYGMVRYNKTNNKGMSKSYYFLKLNDDFGIKSLKNLKAEN